MAAPPPEGGYSPYDIQQPYVSPGSPPHGHGAAHHGRKKRAYAGQAYEFGANSSLGGQMQGGGAYGGYPAPPQSAYGDPTAMMPQPAGYVTPADMGGFTQQFGQLNVGLQQPMAPVAPAAVQGRLPLNQLYPTDLVSQPFSVAELELPPPPIILPPNVGDDFILVVGLLTD